MESILNFLADYWIWFLVVAVILAFALIGYIVQGKKGKKKEEGFETGTMGETPTAPETPIMEQSIAPEPEVAPVAPTLETLDMNEPEIPAVHNFEQPIVNEPVQEVNQAPAEPMNYDQGVINQAAPTESTFEAPEPEETVINLDNNQ